MGQVNSEGLEVRSLAKTWLPLERDSSVLVHCGTHQQAQRHLIRILTKDLPRQTALFATRLNNHHPHILRLLYFHPAPHDHPHDYPHDHDRDFREMHIYTEWAQPLRNWRREAVVMGLQGLRRLITVHGPLRISERMLSENETGEVKVWISENPVNNYPDSKYMSEEQSMADFASLLTRKNQPLANLLIGCITLRDAYDRLLKRQEHSPHQSYSHRASGSGDFKSRGELKDRNAPVTPTPTPYKNVFGNTGDLTAPLPKPPLTPKNNKPHEKYPLSSLQPREPEKSKPVSQINDFSKYRELFIPSKSTANEDKMSSKPNPQNDTSIEYRRKEHHADPKSPVHQGKANETSFDGKRTDYLSFTPKPFVFQHRFETVSNISLHNYPSPKGRVAHWKNANEAGNVYASQNEYSKDPNEYSRGHRWEGSNDPRWEGKEERGGPDITIINNNVSNFISNVTHNHIADRGQKDEKGGREPSEPAHHTHQFKNYARMAQQTTSLHSNPNMKQSQKTRDKQLPPFFLHQKKKTSTQWAQESAELNEKIKANNLSRKNTVSSNPSFESPPQFSSENNLDRILENPVKSSPPEEHYQKNFHLSRNNESSMSTQKMTSFFGFNGVHPLTPTPLSSGYQGFSSFQKHHNSFELKIPLRNKTMQFYQKGKGGTRNEDVQNKSFTQTDFQKSSNDIRPYNKVEIPCESKPQELIPQEEIKSSQMGEQKPTEKKLEFKKQLRNQFKNLLGGDTKQKVEEPVVTMLPLGKIEERAEGKGEEKEGKECREGNLKEKIIRKKTAFAELKKEALKVLTDE